MNFKKTLKLLAPYGLIKWISKKDTIVIELVNTPPLKYTRPLYDTVVSMQGFGVSGHTALVDLLREYSVCTTPVNKDMNADSIEMDFVRLSGGLLEIEKYIESSNVFHNDALIHRFIQQFERFPIFQLNEICKSELDIFFSRIIDFEIKGLSCPFYNSNLQDPLLHNKSIYFLKKMNITDYRNICREFLTNVFNSIHIKGKSILLMDHLFTDMELDSKRDKEYVSNMKTILVTRDPRDVYETAKLKKFEWIPYDDVVSFVKWVKAMYRNYDPNNLDYLIIRFEDLVSDYDKTVSQIESFIGLTPDQHVYKYARLDPNKSIKNIGLWKNSSDVDGNSYIEKELPHLCYYPERLELK